MSGRSNVKGNSAPRTFVPQKGLRLSSRRAAVIIHTSALHLRSLPSATPLQILGLHPVCDAPLKHGLRLLAVVALSRIPKSLLLYEFDDRCEHCSAASDRSQVRSRHTARVKQEVFPAQDTLHASSVALKAATSV